jgi:3-hydroxypropanoate dehydrogenase
MNQAISNDDLDLIFRNARTHNGWLDKPVEDSLLQQVYDLAKWGPPRRTCVHCESSL